jgi:N-acetylglucosamine kinase-like BadF-type ATPase
MIAGVDIGGTKTELLVREGDRNLTRALSTADWRARANPERDTSALVGALRSLTGDRLPSVLVVGSHGCDTDAECTAFQQRLAARLPGTVLVINDAELLLAASGKETGISVVAGTGSIAVSRGADRHMIAAGGWGWYLGDEGSASGLVREAARAVRSAIDEGRPLESLGRALMAAVGVDNAVELGRSLGERGSAAAIGSLAPLVFAAAESGSAIALQVIEHGGKALATLTIRLLGRGASGSDVVTGGGVITRQPRLFEAFGAALAASAPQLTLGMLQVAPVTGAITLAEKFQAGARPAYLPLPHIGGRLVSEAEWAV